MISFLVSQNDSKNLVKILNFCTGKDLSDYKDSTILKVCENNKEKLNKKMDSYIRGISVSDSIPPRSMNGSIPQILGIFPENKLNAKYRTEKSYNGFKPDILKSGLQKYIRRGNLEKSLWCANELDLFAYAPNKEGERIRTNFIHRLMIIYIEDIGPSNLSIFKKVDKLIFDLLNERTLPSRNRKKEISIIEEYVSILAESEHGRSLSHLGTIAKINEFEGTRKLYENFYQGKFEFNPKPISSDRSRPLTIGLEDYKKAKTEIDNFLVSLEQTKKSSETMSFYWARQIINKFGDDKTTSKYFKRSKAFYLIFKLLEPQMAVGSAKELFEISLRWFNEITPLKEDILFIYNLIFVIVNPDNINFKEKSDDLVRNFQEKTGISRRPEWSIYRNLIGEKISIDEYVVDMHTAVGRQAHKKQITFAFEGSHVENESKNVNQIFKQFYNESKIIQEIGWDEFIANRKDFLKIPKEISESSERESPSEREKSPPERDREQKQFDDDDPLPSRSLSRSDGDFQSIEFIDDPTERELFDFQIRAQLVCGGDRACTYFAIDRRTGKRVFVKGPYKNEEHAMVPVKIYNFKKRFFPSLKAIKVEMINLVPDQFPLEKTSLGFRNKILKSERLTLKYPFLVFEDMCYEPIKSREASSKLWPPTKVVDWTKMETCKVPDIYNLSEKAMFSYVLNLLFKYIMGIPDLATRNFIHSVGAENRYDGDFIIGVDEEGWGTSRSPPGLFASLKKNLADFVGKWIDKNYENLLMKILSEWLNEIEENKNESIQILGGEGTTENSKNVSLGVQEIIERLKFLTSKEKTLSLFSPQ